MCPVIGLSATEARESERGARKQEFSTMHGCSYYSMPPETRLRCPFVNAPITVPTIV